MHRTQVALIGRAIAMSCTAAHAASKPWEDPLVDVANLRTQIYLGASDEQVEKQVTFVCARGIPRAHAQAYVQQTRDKMKLFGGSLWGAACRYINENVSAFCEGHLSSDEFRNVIEFNPA